MDYLKNLRLEDLDIDIFEYDDYKSLLQEYFRACRYISSKYSYRHFAKIMGIKSPGYIQSMVWGDRPISDKMLNKLILFLGLTYERQEYFELLVKISKEEDRSPLHKEYLQRIAELRSKRLDPKIIDEGQYEYITSWFHWIIREMVQLKGAECTAEWFTKCLNENIPLSGEEIAEYLDDLKRVKLIEEKDGKITTPDPLISFADERVSKHLKFYHKHVLEQGILGLANTAKNREYGSVLVSTTPENFQLLKEKLKQVRRETIELLQTQNGKGTMLASFSFQLFPVAKIPDEK